MYIHKGEKINIPTQRGKYEIPTQKEKNNGIPIQGEHINVLTQRGKFGTPTQVETKICLHQGKYTVTIQRKM